MIPKIFPVYSPYFLKNHKMGCNGASDR